MSRPLGGAPADPTPDPREVLDGDRVLRVGWLPGSDRLRGRCHCGAEAEGEDPIAMWDWLGAHPAHPAGGPDARPATPVPPRPPAHRVSDPGLLRRVPVPA